MRKGFYLLFIPFVISSLPFFIWQDNLDLVYVAFAGLALGMVLFAYQWIGWYFTVFILTNQRLRQTTQTGLFGKSIIDLGVSKIQNISYNVPGLSGELLGFGTIVIQTYVGDLLLDKIHHPNKIYNILQDAVASTSSYKRDDYETVEE